MYAFIDVMDSIHKAIKAYICAWACLSTYTSDCACPHLHDSRHNMHIYICVCAYFCVYIHMCVCIICVCVCACINIFACVYIYVYILYYTVYINGLLHLPPTNVNK